MTGFTAYVPDTAASLAAFPTTGFVATGGTALRSAADRWADYNSIKDFGAVLGGADIVPAVSGAIAAADGTQVSIKIPDSGFYAVNTTLSYSGKQVWLDAGVGTNYGGSVGFSGLKYDVYHGHEQASSTSKSITETFHFYDWSVQSYLGDAWQRGIQRSSFNLTFPTASGQISTNAGASEWGAYFTAYVPDLSLNLPDPDDSASFCEKDALVGVIETHDGSAQAVGVRGGGVLATPSTDASGRTAYGKAWGGNFTSTVNPGSDGYSVGVEINNTNGGSVSKTIGGVDKIGLKLVPGASGNSITAAIYMQGNGGLGYYNGLWVDQTALVDDPQTRFIKLTSLFEVQRDGSTYIGKSAAGNSTGIELNPSGSAKFGSTVNPTTVSIDGQEGAQRALGFSSLGSTRWLLATSTEGQSNLNLLALDNSGAYASTPMSVNRSTGQVAFGSTPTAPTAAPGTNTTQVATTAFVVGQTAFAVAGGATTTNVPPGQARVVKDTIGGAVKLVYNDGGTLKSVTLS